MAATKPSQILQLAPASEIVFEGPFDEVVTSYLELRNPSDQNVCFKVKTTAPKRYCVRPNSGLVEPTGKVKIAIMLQPMEQDNQAERNKHKFMVQSTIIRNDSSSKDNLNLDLIWANAAQEDIMDSKLRCVFQTPTSTNAKVEEPTPTSTTTTNTISANKSTASAVEATTSSNNASTAKSNTSTTTSTNSTNQQHAELRDFANTLEKQHLVADDGKSISREKDSQQASSSPTSSTRESSAASTERILSKDWESNIASQRTSEDYRVVIVSLVMLIIGVILGKYII